MMDVLIFAAGGVTALVIAWLVQTIFRGLIEGMNGATSRRKKGRSGSWFRMWVDVLTPRSSGTEDVQPSSR